MMLINLIFGLAAAFSDSISSDYGDSSEAIPYNSGYFHTRNHYRPVRHTRLFTPYDHKGVLEHYI